VDAVVLATAYGDAVAALQSLGDLNGAVVIDITNPLTADYMGLTLGHSTSAAEEIAGCAGRPTGQGLQHLFAQVLAAGADFGQGRHATVFLASDSAAAKQVASTLAQSMGFEVVDAGGLKNARYLEPLAGLNIYLGYGAGWAPPWPPPGSTAPEARARRRRTVMNKNLQNAIAWLGRLLFVVLFCRPASAR
jgi:predicted dinucleotide-binding enzyme